jgi:hypothetical protein
MLQIRKQGAMISTVFSGSEQDRENLRAQFERDHYIRFPGFLEAGLLQTIQHQVSEAVFVERVHDDIGSNKELCMRKDNTIYRMLNFIVNTDILYKIICDVLRCDQNIDFSGRVYRLIPGCGHHDEWHDDLDGRRLVAMSVNLSTDVYSGGVLQIRNRHSGEILQGVANVGFGDAIIFRLADHLQHRLTELQGTAPKIAYAGWFRRQSDPS